MHGTSTVEPDKRKGVPTVGIVSPEILRRKWNAIQKMIARRAYELFEVRGRVPGHQLEDWAQAESELLYPCCIRLGELADPIVLRADLPGSFTADQLRVGIETRQVMIEGEREINVICGHWGKTRNTHRDANSANLSRLHLTGGSGRLEGNCDSLG